MLTQVESYTPCNTLAKVEERSAGKHSGLQAVREDVRGTFSQSSLSLEETLVGGFSERIVEVAVSERRRHSAW